MRTSRKNTTFNNLSISLPRNVIKPSLISRHRYQINTAKGILDSILNVQPKEGNVQGGETRESVVYRLAEDMLQKLPKTYNSFEVNLYGPMYPYNVRIRETDFIICRLESHCKKWDRSYR